MAEERTRPGRQTEQLYEVLLGYLEAAEGGRRPDPEELLARHPDLAPELKEFLAAHEQVEGLAAPFRAATPTPPDASAPGTTPDLRAAARPPAGLLRLWQWLRRHPVPAAAGHPSSGARAVGELGRLGPYRLLEVLGGGGMGIVFRGEDVDLQRPVAVKVLRPELAADPGARQRFLREARSAAALDHEHVVTVYRVGEDGGIPFLAMQWLRGQSLEEILRQTGALETPTVLRLGRQTALGLAAAHGHGLLHRDIKPANLWVESPGPRSVPPEKGRAAAASGRVKILDFGLARAAADEDHLTHSGATVGTPSYMAPEQAAGGAVDDRCDLFGLGVVLYRMCTGQFPFPDRAARAGTGLPPFVPPRPVRDLNPTTPPALAELIAELLAEEPAERPASAAAVAERLQALEAQQAVPAAAGQALPPRVPRRRHLPGRRAWRRWAGAAAVALVAVLSLGYLLVRAATRPAPGRGAVAPAVHGPEAGAEFGDDGAGQSTTGLLREVAGQLAAGQDRLPAGLAQVYDRAEEIHRSALRGRRDGDPDRADELSAAANDAARGLRCVVRACLLPEAEMPPPGDDRPPPPPRGRRSKGPPPHPPGPPPGGEPREVADHTLRHARDRLDEVGDDAGTGKPFVDAARDAYARARKAYADGEYRRAAELAHGAAVWTHVGDHLWRAGYEGAAPRSMRGPPHPPPREKRGNRPPPPPPDDDEDGPP